MIAMRGGVGIQGWITLNLWGNACSVAVALKKYAYVCLCSSRPLSPKFLSVNEVIIYTIYIHYLTN